MGFRSLAMRGRGNSDLTERGSLPHRIDTHRARGVR